MSKRGVVHVLYTSRIYALERKRHPGKSPEDLWDVPPHDRLAWDQMGRFAQNVLEALPTGTRDKRAARLQALLANSQAARRLGFHTVGLDRAGEWIDACLAR